MGGATVASAPYEKGAFSVKIPNHVPPNSVVRPSPHGNFLFPKVTDIDAEDIAIFDKVRSKFPDGKAADVAAVAGEFDQNVNGLGIVKLALGVCHPDCVLKWADSGEDQNGKDKNSAIQAQHEKKARFRDFFVQELLRRGFIIEHEDSKLDPAEHYVKVYAPFDLLLHQAEQNNTRMRLAQVEPMERKPTYTDAFLKRFGHTKFAKLFFAAAKPRHASAVFAVERYKEFIGSDKFPACGGAGGCPTKEETFFSPALRSLLVHSCISRAALAPWEDKGKPCMVGELLQRGVFTKYYYTHDGDFQKPPETGLRAFLFHNWVMSPGIQPLDVVRDYMGEKIALYYGWLGFYTSWLGVAAIVGFVVFIYGLAAASGAEDFSFEKVFDNELSAPFALFMSVWSTLFLEFWKRENARLKVRWNTYDFEEKEPPRPGFIASKQRKSPITGEMEEVFPRSMRLIKIAVSSLAVGLSIVFVCAIVFAIIVFRPWIRNKYKDQDSATPAVATALLSLVLIRTASMTYVRLAEWLNDWENHRTDTEYEDALILKRYLFEFVNYYSSLFYVAIFKQWTGRRMLGDPELNDVCGFNGSCLSDLMVQLAIVFVGNQITGQIMEVGIPYMMVKWQHKRAKKLKEERLRNWKQANNNDACAADVPQHVEDDLLQPAGSVFDEYSEMVIQFGFCSLFVAAFPLAPLFAFLNNVVEIHTDSYKMITQTQRGPGFRAQDIGSWEVIMGLVSKISVLTNAVVIAFSSKATKMELGRAFGWEDEAEGKPLLASQLAFILIFEHAVLLLKLLAEHFVADVPESVANIINRDAYLEEKYKEKQAALARVGSASQQAVNDSRALEKLSEVVVMET